MLLLRQLHITGVPLIHRKARAKFRKDLPWREIDRASRKLWPSIVVVSMALAGECFESLLSPEHGCFALASKAFKEPVKHLKKSLYRAGEHK
jgi:hypothetical protein